MAEAMYDPLAYVLRVLFVLALLFAVVFWLRRRSGGAAATGRRQLHIVESMALGPQRNLHIVAVGERQYLIGATPHTFTFLTEIDTRSRPSDAADTDAAVGCKSASGTNFEKYLEKDLRRYNIVHTEAERGVTGQGAPTQATREQISEET